MQEIGHLLASRHHNTCIDGRVQDCKFCFFAVCSDPEQVDQQRSSKIISTPSLFRFRRRRISMTMASLRNSRSWTTGSVTGRPCESAASHLRVPSIPGRQRRAVLLRSPSNHQQEAEGTGFHPDHGGDEGAAALRAEQAAAVGLCMGTECRGRPACFRACSRWWPPRGRH